MLLSFAARDHTERSGNASYRLSGAIGLGFYHRLTSRAHFSHLLQRLHKLSTSGFAVLQDFVGGLKFDANRFKAKLIARILQFILQ